MAHIDPCSAWMAVREDLDNQLAEANSDGCLNVTAVTSMPASGKSTTMLSHIFQLAREGRAPNRVIYVIPDETETVLLKRWMIMNNVASKEEYGDMRLGSDNKMTLATTRDFAKYLVEDGVGGTRRLTLVVDVSWYPTWEEETMFAALARWGQQQLESGDCRVAVVLLMSVFESRRTLELMEKSFGKESVRRLTFPDLHEWPKVQILGRGWNNSMADHVADVIDQGGRVIRASETEIPDLNHTEASEMKLPSANGTSTAIQDVTELLEVRLLSLAPDYPFSTQFEKLRLFISSVWVTESLQMDDETFQLVIRRRRLERCELMRHQSWVLKSGADLDKVEFLVTYDPSLVDAPQTFLERFGPAWNEDLLPTALSLTKIIGPMVPWKMSIRKPPSPHIWEEANVRLHKLGCLELDMERTGAFQVTDFGASVYRNMTDHQVNFYAAYLLAMSDTEGDLVIRRLLIRIAALASIDMAVCHVADDPQPGTWAIPIIVKDRLSDGFIWLTLGVFLSIEYKGPDLAMQNAREHGGVVKRGGLVILPQNVEVTLARVEKIERMHDIHQHDRSWMNRPLSDQRAGVVNRALMWTWLFRMVWIDGGAKPDIRGHEPARDLVTTRQCIRDIREFPIDVVHLRERAIQAGMSGGICAIYHSMHEIPSGGYKVALLTSIPIETFDDVEEKTGEEWPEVVMSE
ncbi:hypothetical protein GGR54DRAFT_626232 [Hypoxylon sp. NC1633]|nr:hypothetical protein GGR54DRAFT_626232 [Hypoxylon sp. NC1633]